MKTILVVEDDPAVQRGIRENLEHERFRVFVERDGAKALQRARRDPPDLMILDVMLPSMNGFDLCARLKGEGFTPPIFMLTGLGDELSRLKGLGLGADDYLSKPFSIQELLLRVRNSLDRSDRSLGKARALEQEFGKAREIQRNALPAQSPRVAGLDVSGIMIPATHVGGDYFDYLSLGPDRFGVIVADVSGKGMPAALYVHKMLGVVHASRAMASSAADLLFRLQEHLGSSLESDSFVTAVVAVFDVKHHTVDIASAGHPPVFFKRGNRLFEVPAGGMIIGQAIGTLFSELLKPAQILTEPGDTFFFYSDGIPEAMNSRQEEFGFDRMKRMIAGVDGTAQGIVRQCLRHVRKFTGDEPQSDDITILTVTMTGKGPD